MKEGTKLVYVLFVGLLIASIFLPSEISFMGFMGLIVGYIVIGFFVPEMFDDLSRVLGVYLCIILLVEGAHAVTAYGYGIPVKGANVNLLEIADGEGEIMSGWVELDIGKDAIDASSELQNQISWVAAAGSIVLVLFGGLYFALSKTIFPAIIASLCFFKHQAPFLWNDQAMCIQNSWMSSVFAWIIFVVGLVILVLAGIYAMKKREKRVPRRAG